MKQNTNTIVLTGGGSGGHITPLLSLARELKKENKECQIVYIGLKGEKVEGLQSHYQAFDRVCTVPAGKFRRYHGESFLAHLTDVKTLLLNIRDAFRVLRGILAASRLLKSINPAVVFSKGSFVAVPVGVAAHRLGTPIVTHDSDTVPGLANRILSRWAVVHATGMPAEYYSYPKESTFYTGIPLSDKIKEVSALQQQEYKKQLGLPVEAEVITVSGGGLGSVKVNNLMVAAAARLFKERSKLHILHICGEANLESAKNAYAQALNQDQLKRLVLLGFTDEFYKYTGAADLVVARAGATTIAELALQAKPAIIIPSPFLTGGHQLKNAQHLARSGAVETFSEEESAEKLQDLIFQLLENKDKRNQLEANIKKLAKPEAGRELAHLVLRISQGGVEQA